MKCPKINWNSMSFLKNLLTEEKTFKLQIISLEDLKIFCFFLDHCKVKYELCSFGCKLKTNIHIYTNTTNINCDYKKIVVFANKPIPKFLQVKFQLSYDEKLKFLDFNFSDKKKNKFVLDMHKTQPLHVLYRNIKDEYIDYSKYLENEFDYTESLIIFSMVRFFKFDEIVKNINVLNSKFGNYFVIKMKLDSLVKKKIVRFEHGAYRLNLSYDSLEVICKQIDLDLKMM